MNFSSNISLTHRSAIAVASSLWNKEDIIADIKYILETSRFRKRWSDIESNVMLHVRNTVLPVELKLNLENLVEPMGMHLYKWISLTRPLFYAFCHSPANIRFFWNERGTLDYVKTTTFIIGHCLQKELCFCLACMFCVEKTIYELWPEVGQTIRETIQRLPVTVKAAPLLYWVYFLNGDVETLMASAGYCGHNITYEFAFLFSLEVKCTSSLRYFLERVQPERRKTVVRMASQKVARMALQNIVYTSRPHEGNVLVFLFSYLEESDISQIISENTYCVLASLLEWPCQEFFVPVAHSYCSQLSSLDCLHLLQDIVKCLSGLSGSVYKNLVKEFWKSLTPPHKEYVIARCMSGIHAFLGRLFIHENTYEIVQMIFRDCSPNEWLRMIFYYEGGSICDLLVKTERWDYLKLFVTRCIPTREDFEEFMSAYETYRPYYHTKEIELRRAVLKRKVREWY